MSLARGASPGRPAGLRICLSGATPPRHCPPRSVPEVAHAHVFVRPRSDASAAALRRLRAEVRRNGCDGARGGRVRRRAALARGWRCCHAIEW